MQRNTSVPAYQKLHAQIQDCGECLKSLLVEVVDKQPDLEEHASIVRNHLEAVQRELELLVRRINS
jgi:hypothetical protein